MHARELGQVIIIIKDADYIDREASAKYLKEG